VAGLSPVPRIALIVAVVGAALAAASSAGAASRYCSPSGDFCTSTQRISGAVYLRLSTFSFSGPVKVCVTEPGGIRQCRTFRLRRRGSVWQLSLRWHTYFSPAGPGRYRVAFFLGRTRLGPVLDFRKR
jgi:hypothetical protein